jgi:uncharacterized membrane protein
MWIITVLPEWVFHLILSIGVLGLIFGFVLGAIPLVKRYKLGIQIISGLMLILGIYLQGALADFKEWQQKAAELQVKMAEMETKLAQTDTKIIEKVITKTQVIREKGKEVIKYVDREVVKYDTKFLPGGECELPQEFFKAYNESLGKGVK